MKGAADPQQLALLELPAQRRPQPVDRTKVGFTASRSGMTPAQAAQLIIELHRAGATDLHHGDCVGGDEQAHAIGRQLGLHIVGHPPAASGLRAYTQCDELRAPCEYLVRNRAIVLETELLIGAPQGPEKLRSGTWATIRLARRMRVPLLIIFPDGRTT